MTQKVGTIRDVAQATGLSIATISRVMNGAKNVSEATRAKVLEASARLNYVPNAAARALSTNRSRTIAAILPSVDHSIYAKFTSSLEKTMASRGYSLVIAVSGGDPEVELTAARKLLGMGAEGVILSGLDHAPELIELLQQRGIPHVARQSTNLMRSYRP